MRSRRDLAVDAGWSALLALAVLGPVLFSNGYVLRGDMVFVPHLPWKPAWLGLDGSVPRSVPMDAIVWLASHLVGGQLVQKLALLTTLMTAGIGAGSLVGRHPVYARLAAITFFVWNPWVHDRLSTGQWAIVAGYALLPWVVVTAVRLRDDGRRWGGLAGLLVLAAVCGPSSGLTALLVAMLITAYGGRGRLGLTAGLGVVANLPWLVPGLLVPGGVGGGGAAYSAFAPRAESAAGVVASLLSLGGMWKTSIWAQERGTAAVVLFAAGLSAVAVVGLRREAREGDRRSVVALAAGGALTLVAALLTTVPDVRTALDDWSDTVPGLAFFRDSQRYLALFAVALVPGIAAASTGIVRWAGTGREAARALVGLLVLAPVLLLPSLAWGLRGELRAVTWPADWTAVADILDGQDQDTVVVLPWQGSYRGFAWNHRQAALDPAPRALPGDVLIDDRVIVGDIRIPSESGRLQAVASAVEQADPARALSSLGVRWVLVEKGQGTSDQPIPAGVTAYDGPDLRLIDLGVPDHPPPTALSPAKQLLVLTADALTFGLGIALTGIGLFRRYW